MSITNEYVLKLESQLKSLRESRDQWKERACAAENRLEAIANSLYGHLEDRDWRNYLGVDELSLPPKKFDIWSEGYAASGESAPHMFHGSVEAPTFKEACIKHFGSDALFDPERLTYWSCRLFDNAADAAKTFG